MRRSNTRITTCHCFEVRVKVSTWIPCPSSPKQKEASKGKFLGEKHSSVLYARCLKEQPGKVEFFKFCVQAQPFAVDSPWWAPLEGSSAPLFPLALIALCSL